MSVRLPSRLHHARVVRVRSLNCLEVDLDLGFGISVMKRIVLEGVDYRGIPKALRSDAKHCLVVLLGGKRVVVHTDQSKQDGFILGRVYLDERVYGKPEGLTVPFGLTEPMLEVGAFYTWLAGKEFDVHLVKVAINGTGRS